MLQPPAVQTWPVAYSALGKIFSEPQYMELKPEDGDDGGITAIDFEEQNAGYQAAYSRLAASETRKEIDPVGYVQNPLQYLNQELEKLTAKYGPVVQNMISKAEGGRIG